MYLGGMNLDKCQLGMATLGQGMPDWSGRLGFGRDMAGL